MHTHPSDPARELGGTLPLEGITPESKSQAGSPLASQIMAGRAACVGLGKRMRRKRHQGGLPEKPQRYPWTQEVAPAWESLFRE